MRRVGPPTASPAKPECLRRCSTSGSANWWERRRCNIWRAGACAPPAAHLLREPGRNASGVAYSVGFNSEAAFNRAFKREFGVPPATWRRNSLAEEALRSEPQVSWRGLSTNAPIPPLASATSRRKPPNPNSIG
ncbi:helix-turn-helix domain-containing protein [Allosphingosinicella sp.]|uniref:helix-turn-helix domain-containing protein n=1 Tax=Allosphingosinicella sp. TaxID=2823234 RepID=UPI003D713D84